MVMSRWCWSPIAHLPAAARATKQYCAQKFIELGYQSWAYRVVNSAGERSPCGHVCLICM